MRPARVARIFVSLLLVAGCHATRGAMTPQTRTIAQERATERERDATRERAFDRDPRQALAAVAREERSLFSLAAGDAGIAYALRRDDASGEDPRADAQGSIAVTTRICTANDPNLARLTRALASHFDPAFDYVPLVCEGLVCNARGPMEFATSLRFVFSDAPETGLVLREVYEIEDVAIGEDFAAARWRDAEGAVRASPSRCGSE